MKAHMTDDEKPALADIAAALALLSRVPVPLSGAPRGAAASWAWPLAGAVIGALAGGVGALALAIGLPAPLAAGLALAMGPILTGAMHEDGLADSADGLWGGWTPERRLEIMKDSHIGSYGVIALVLSLGLRWVALALLFQAGHGGASLLIGIAALSRLPMVALAHRLPFARPGGLSARVGAPGVTTLAIAAFVAVLIAISCLGVATVPVLLAISATTFAVGAMAQAKIGGQTGDILGAAQQLGEIAALITLSALRL